MKGERTGRLRRAIMAALVLSMLITPSVQGDYLQHMGNAARTGATTGNMPPLVISYEMDLPGGISFDNQPLIVGGYLYYVDDGLDEADALVTDATTFAESIIRVALQTGVAEAIWTSPAGVLTGFASDGEFLFAVSEAGVHALTLDGEEAWITLVDFGLTTSSVAVACLNSAVEMGQLFVVCNVDRLALGNPATDTVWIASINTKTGAIANQRTAGLVDGTEHLVASAFAVGRQGLYLAAFYGGDVPRATVERYDATSLEQTHVYSRPLLAHVPVDPYTADTDPSDLGRYTQDRPEHVGLWGDRVYLNSQTLVSLDADNLEFVWELDGFTDDTNRVADGGFFSFVGPRIVTAMPGSIGIVSWLEGELESHVPIDGTDVWTAGDNAFVADGKWLAEASLGRILVADVQTGEIIESRLFGSSSQIHAMADGILAVLSAPPQVPTAPDGPVQAGQLRVFGETDASMKGNLEVSKLRPAVGEKVKLSLDGATPGAFGDAVSYLVDWGDGAATPPSPEANYEHQYDTAGIYHLRISGSNDQGQEFLRTATVEVGATSPTFLETRFDAENQESTFFTLGLILTLLFAGFGTLRLRRKRGTLRKELAKADAIVASTKDDPDKLREQLRDHRSKARRLFLDGRLDEGSTGILERHIDELLRDHRLSKVEAELGFLPHELFRSMQEMLRDAKVTQLERNQFLRSLQSERSLTAPQKRRVKSFVETWHAQDTA